MHKRGFFDFCIFTHFIAIFRFWPFFGVYPLNLTSNISAKNIFFKNRSLVHIRIYLKKRLQKKLSRFDKNLSSNLERCEKNAKFIYFAKNMFFGKNVNLRDFSV